MILEGKALYKSYPNASLPTPVLQGVDLAIEQGEFLSIMGKSGSGKSTLLNILSTLDHCDKGEVHFAGQDISRLNEAQSAALRRERFGFVFQLPRMVKNLNILDNILLPSLRYAKDREGARKQALELLESMGIAELAEKKITQVSGGQLQRAGICRALINSPDLLFADEPTGALDSKSGEQVLALFTKFHKAGKSIVLVTHDVEVAARSQRVLLMKDGRLQESVAMDGDRKSNVSKLRQTLEAI